MNAKKSESRRVAKPLPYRKTTRFDKLMTMAALPLLFLLFAAAASGQSALDGFDPNANGQVLVVVVQPDGKILLGGDFTTLSPNGGASVTRNRIARLNPDGTLDTAFNPNANHVVYSIAVQADGKILAGGFFGSIGGQTRSAIARLDATTGLADSFNPNANGDVHSIAVQADGKILVGGLFNFIGGQTRNNMARLDATTGQADSFDPNASGPVESIVVQGDGKILAGGWFTSIGGEPRNFIARLDPTTGLADMFDPNAELEVRSIAVQADGKILAGGTFTSIGGQPRNRIARLDPTTGLADSFNPNANDTVWSIAVQTDGKILAGGFFNGANSIGGQTRNHIARLDPTTGLADSFNPDATGFSVVSIAVQADGKILAGGSFNSIGGGARNNIARLETDGRLDQTLNLGITGAPGVPVSAITNQPDGRVVIGGHFDGVLGVPRNRIARLNTDGTLDTAFDPNSNNEVYSTAVQADGKVLVGGGFTNIGGQPRISLARLNATTGLADSFNPTAGFNVNSIRVPTDGKVLVGGSFSTIGGQPRNNIARLDATGAADSFNPDADSSIYSVLPLRDGRVLACGFFHSMGGETRNHIAAVNSNGTLDTAFNPNSENLVWAMAVQADGKILVAGSFKSIGGQARSSIARLDPTTGLADSFNPDPSGTVQSIAVQADGKILAGGGFQNIGGQARRWFARLDPVTGLADSYDPNPDGDVFVIGQQADGKIFASGLFNTIGGTTRDGFARLTNDTAALQNLAVTRTTINWTLGGSSPQFTRASFEYSNDNVNYVELGSATAVGSNWTRIGLNLPGGSFYIRARGYYPSGSHGSSESVLYSVRNAFLVPTAVSITASSGTIIGGTISGAATLSGGMAPTGTITFNVYGPNDPACGGTVAFSSSSNVNGNGNYSSASFTPTSAGTYRFVVIYSGDEENASSSTACDDANGSVVVSKMTPSITGAASASVPVGSSVSDSATLAAGFNPFGTITFTLFGPNNSTCAGTPIFTSAKPVNGNGNFDSGPFTPASPGTYRFIATYSGDANNNAVATACGDAGQSVVVLPGPTTLGNISTRLRVETGDNVLIGGFIITGTQPKRIIVRAIGPSLPLAGALADPVLELRNSSGGLIMSNDNWRTGGQEAEIIATTIPPSNDLESAIVATLPANGSAYTAIVRGVANGTGIGVVEAYDLDRTVNSKLANISTRGLVQTGDDVLIGGLIVLGQNPLRVIIRAIGPSLPLSGALENPTLALHDGNGALLISNDNWRDDPTQESEIIATGIPPSNDLESAIVRNLQPGNYTAIVRGVNNTTGIAVVEAYGLN